MLENSKISVRAVLVIGDNPDELMKKYDKNLKVEPYVKYKYLDAEKIRKTAVKTITQVVNNADALNLNEFQKDYFKNQLKSISSMSSFEYYQMLTDGMYYDEEGNAMSTDNPNGKHNGYNKGGNFSYPFLCKDGTEKYECNADEVDWDKVNMREEAVNYFNLVWDIKVDGRKPENEYEEKIANDWKDRDAYLENFKSKDELVRHNCAYWSYAVLTEDGWFSLDDGGTEDEWINGFMDRFIRPLTNEKLTVYEFAV